MAGLLILVWAVPNRSRLVADASGLRRVTMWGPDVRLLKWKDVRSWRVESYESNKNTEDGQVRWMSRLVVELKNASPLVVEESWFTVAVKELRVSVPELQAFYAAPRRLPAPDRMEVIFPSEEE